jgi:hypothetical protein
MFVLRKSERPTPFMAKAFASNKMPERTPVGSHRITGLVPPIRVLLNGDTKIVEAHERRA